VAFYSWLTSLKPSTQEMGFKSLHYAIFGLGNSSYVHYNAVAQYIDRKLCELGGIRVYELGLADDANHCTEEDFLKWKEDSIPFICQFFSIDFTIRNYFPISKSINIQELSREDMTDRVVIFTGEVGPLFTDYQKSLKKKRIFFDSKNPFYARILSYEYLSSVSEQSERQVLRLELGLDVSGIHYQVGDHLAIMPQNNSILVERLGLRLGIHNMDQLFILKRLDQEHGFMSLKRTFFPTPCSYRTALTYYLDISAPLKAPLLKACAEATTDLILRDFLSSLTTSAGKEAYTNYILSPCKTLLHVLEEHPSIKLPVDLCFELLPRLQYRYYSISSSPRVSPLFKIKAVYLSCFISGSQGSYFYNGFTDRKK
jgi:NADPH-ferrihemoprotein reductase